MSLDVLRVSAGLQKGKGRVIHWVLVEEFNVNYQNRDL